MTPSSGVTHLVELRDTPRSIFASPRMKKHLPAVRFGIWWDKGESQDWGKLGARVLGQAAAVKHGRSVKTPNATTPKTASPKASFVFFL